jgi:hypothetical protein
MAGLPGEKTDAIIGILLNFGISGAGLMLLACFFINQLLLTHSSDTFSQFRALLRMLDLYLL